MYIYIKYTIEFYNTIIINVIIFVLHHGHREPVTLQVTETLEFYEPLLEYLLYIYSNQPIINLVIFTVCIININNQVHTLSNAFSWNNCFHSPMIVLNITECSI